MNGIWYSVVINCLNTFLAFYLPSVYILSPRKGSRYLNWAVLSFWYSLWVILSRFVLKFPLVVYMITGNVGLMWILMRHLYLDSWKRLLSVIVFITFVIGSVSEVLTVLFLRIIIPAIFQMYIHAQMGNMANQLQLIGNLFFEMAYMAISAAYFCLARRKERKLFLEFLLLPLYQFVLVTGFCTLCSDFTVRVAQTGLIIGIFGFAMDLLMLHFLYSILETHDVEAKIREQERLRQQEYAYFRVAGRSAEELRMIRHDFSNHLQAVYKMSDGAGNRDTVKEMLEEMSRRIGEQGADEGYDRMGDGAVCQK